METRQHKHLWIDLVTSSTDASTGEILEIALALVEDDRAGNLDITTIRSVAIQPSIDLSGLGLPAWLRETYRLNRLFADCDRGLPRARLNEWIRAFLSTHHVNNSGGRIMLAGWNPSFDRPWFESAIDDTSLVAAHTFDVATLVRSIEIWMPSAHEGAFEKPSTYRAERDLRTTIQYASAYRELVGL